jgi:serine/threonine protein kinase
MHATK